MGQHNQELNAEKTTKNKQLGNIHSGKILGWANTIQKQEYRNAELAIAKPRREQQNRSHTVGKIPPGTILRTQQTRHDMSVLQKDAKRDGQAIHPYGSKATRRKPER